jgi:DNA-binding MarR family transcriptional regulator
MTKPHKLYLSRKGQLTRRCLALRYVAANGPLTNGSLQARMGISSGYAGTLLCELYDLGYVQRLQKDGIEVTRWRITPEGAQALADVMARHKGEPPPLNTAPIAVVEPKPGAQLVVPRRASVEAPITVRGSMAPRGDAIIPPGVRVTICPSPAVDHRYQVAPGDRPFGAGFSACGIGRDVATGRAWGGRG